MVDFTDIVKRNSASHKQTRRAPVYVGFQCHQGCGFCYYKHSCNDKMFSFEKIKKQIDFLNAYGVQDYEITGGEPGEHKQLEDICKYIKDIQQSSKIAVITNGSIFNRDIFNLIDEVLVSYHLSKNCRLYDKDIFPKGCTWSKVKATIDKARQFNKIVRTNTVLGTFNLDDAMSIADDLIELQPDIVNFLPVNLFEQSSNMHKYIDYNKLRDAVKHVINKIEVALSNSLVLVRYMPFCCMEGYESHLLGHVQHAYDQFDWMPEISGIEHISKMDNELLKKLGACGSTSISSAFQTRNQLYAKTADCMKCKHYLICDGVEKTSDNSLLKYIQPSIGKLEADAMKYIGDSILNKYRSLYRMI